MLIAVAVLASLAFIGWLVYRAARQRPVRAHTVCYAVAYLTAIYTFAFFMSMDILRLFKILASILLGTGLIILAAYVQRRRARKAEERQ